MPRGVSSHCTQAWGPSTPQPDSQKANRAAALDWITTLARWRSKLVVAKRPRLVRGANVMLIIGCDFHPGFQQVAIFDNRTGEISEKRLQHRAEAEQFCRSLASPLRVGMEACGHYPWFEGLLQELGFELWMGDAAQIRASVVRKQKTDRRDAEHILQLLIEDRFPQIWVPKIGRASWRE